MAELMYDPTTGKFWREAGCASSSGYRQIWFDGKQQMEHRVAWFLHYGVWPDKQINHINGIRSDNRISNLRLSTNSENMYNRAKPKNNASGFKGVSWNQKRQKWQVSITYRRVTQSLGAFTNLEDAAAAYQRAALHYHGEFANLDL